MEDYSDVKFSIEREGIGYFLMDYIDSSEMPDEKGKELFDEAVNSLKKFQDYVELQYEKEENTK